MVDCPAAFRAMKPFLARAEELDNSPNDEPKVGGGSVNGWAQFDFFLGDFCFSLGIFKLLAPFQHLSTRPNDEINKVVAYYCRQYAMERGLEIRTTDPTVDPSYLVTLMTRLEVGDYPTIVSYRLASSSVYTTHTRGERREGGREGGREGRREIMEIEWLH